eukprot:31154-Pelagococcus_subviridis.AAC.12
MASARQRARVVDSRGRDRSSARRLRARRAVRRDRDLARRRSDVASPTPRDSSSSLMMVSWQQFSELGI